VSAAPLFDRIPSSPAPPDALLELFLDYTRERGLALYPAQEEALLEIFAGKNVILATPTGSGKSLVATAHCFFAMTRGLRAFYTCPIKALVSEKFFALCGDFGPDRVGMMTGDASVNRDAPIICCTAEILANMALREGAAAPADAVVMDEFHYYADRDRGVAWQVPLLTLPRATFLLMSATLGPTEVFEERLTKLTGKPTVTVSSRERPVPLDFTYRETPLHETVLELVRGGRAPVYVVSFTQKGCAEEAQNLMSLDFCTKDEKKSISAHLEGARFDTPYGKEIQRFLRHGIGLHHAGLLPKYRLRVEKLAQTGLLKIICGTDTLGVGVNIPIRTVLLTKLCKFDGEKTRILSVRDFQQIAGRAGRKGFDDRGSVVVQAPEHVIENLRMEQKAGDDPAKKRKIVRKKPPERGYVHWDRSTFDKLVGGVPEPLLSRFSVTHGMLLNVLSQRRGCRAMARLIHSAHERRAEKRIHARTAAMMYRSLLDAGIVTVESGKPTVHADLQEDFSLNHALSLYLVETCARLDRDSDSYALDLLTLVESILEDPDTILYRQLDKLKTLKMAEMKAAGMEYDERIEELDKLEYPKPNREFVYATFNEFAAKHPWVGQDNIRPKAVAREMVESYLSFVEYVKEYGLERAEGLLLRYLSGVYKVLVQTVPHRAKSDEVWDLVDFFGAMVRQIDSSLLDEWEGMRRGSRHDLGPAMPGLGRGSRQDLGPAMREEREVDILAGEREFTVLVRNLCFSLLRALARRDYDRAAELVEGMNRADFETRMQPFWAEHAQVRLDPAARSPAHLRITQDEDVWRVQQVILDNDDAGDWFFEGTIDLARSREAARPILWIARISQ
jgi:superfamily II RNA helicase